MGRLRVRRPVQQIFRVLHELTDLVDVTRSVQIFSATIDPKAAGSRLGMARARKWIEELGAASPADIFGRGRHAVALLAEDNALAWRGQLPEPGEVGVLPAFAVEVAHRRLVVIAGEERR